ncbi:MAG: ribose-phosphate pyrophosphokinase [Micropepsaceae bacterium]
MPSVVIAYPGNEDLAQSLATQSGAELVPLEFRHFPDGEIYLRVAGDVGGKTAIIACGLERPNEKAIGLYLLASTLRELGARRILLAAPYLGYMRQDRSFHPGEGMSARYFAQFLSSFLDGLVTVDPHLHRIHDLQEVYTVPTRVVAAAPAISSWVASNVEAPVLIGPDSESEQWVSQVAQGAKCPFVVLEKKRFGDRSVEVSVPDPGQLRDRTPVLIDDIISTAKTMIAAVEHVVGAGLRPPVCVGVHAIFAGSAYGDLSRAGAARIVTCNTVPHPTNAIDVHTAVVRAVAELA